VFPSLTSVNSFGKLYINQLGKHRVQEVITMFAKLIKADLKVVSASEVVYDRETLKADMDRAIAYMKTIDPHAEFGFMGDTVFEAAIDHYEGGSLKDSATLGAEKLSTNKKKDYSKLIPRMLQRAGLENVKDEYLLFAVR